MIQERYKYDLAMMEAQSEQNRGHSQTEITKMLDQMRANLEADPQNANGWFMLARTAVLGALFNVSINLGGIKDEAFCQKMRKRVQELRRYAEEQEKELLSLSPLGKEF